ncbi:MAG: ribonuclease E/G, partial [Candidatus Obscuribacter sp.]|nr:ribonuclease E/G [Candidatus Obscuribacter sp.]
QEIPRQLRLRNIGGMVIVDFIDMDSRKDQQQVLEAFQRSLEEDRAKPQIGQLSDLGLVELTRRRQGQSLRELFTRPCTSCHTHGVIPALELGPPEDRRIIAFRSKEEESVSRKNRGRNRSQPLKSATAVSGRVMPSHVESELDEVPEELELISDIESELDDVPEEILEMMPEDLLDARAQGKQPAKQVSFDDDDEDDDGDTAGGAGAQDSHGTIEIRSDVFQPKKALYEERIVETEEESTTDLASDLAKSVSAVESVYQELDLFSAEETEFASATAEPEVEKAAAAPITYEVESPYEAEVDPVTGIYRLKTKTAEDEAESGVDGSSAISLGLDQGVPVLDTSEAVSFGESTDYTPNFTLAREESAKESVSQLTLPAFSSLEASESDFGSQSSEGRDDNE